MSVSVCAFGCVHTCVRACVRAFVRARAYACVLIRMRGECRGIGMVDKVRRGGTDTGGAWIGKEKEAMDPLIPQVKHMTLPLHT